MNPANTERVRLALLRSILSESLAEFFAYFWPAMEPTRAMLPSIALDAMCAAGQAVADGRIKRLAVSTCPGTAKSLFWAVAFPAFLLLRTHGRARTMVGSYSWGFAMRDSARCRDLVQSERFQEVLDGEWEIRADANHKDDFWTTATGRRLITSVEGKSTGERCTWQIIDDALSAASVFSIADKLEAIRWLNQVLTSRLEDQRVDPRVIVGQRLCVGDPIDEAIRQGWKYLYLPAVLADGEEGCVLLDDHGVEVWRDPRAPGEPIVELLDPPALAGLRVALGSNAFAAQYLQKPTDDSAALIKRTWWRFYRPEHVRGDVPRPAGCDEVSEAVEMPAHFERITIGVDLTFGSKTGDYAVAQAWGASRGGRYLLAQWRERAGFDESIKAIKRLKATYPNAKIVIEKAANGAAVIETLSKEIPGVVAVKPIGPKAARIGAMGPTVESGACYLPLGASWLGDFVEELAGATTHDDAADAAAYSLADLNRQAVPSAALGGMMINVAR